MQSEQLDKIREGNGFIAALDQSGGSTPKALRIYGIGEDEYANEDEMFDLIHQMRTRIITSPCVHGRADRRRDPVRADDGPRDRRHGHRPVPLVHRGRRPVPEGRQGPRRRGRRRAADEADARSRRPAGACRRQGRVRHQDALGDQAGRSRRCAGDRRPAVRGRSPDPGRRTRAHPRARGRHHQPAEGGGRGAPARRAGERARRRSPTVSRSCSS